jgi:hypothetical protein
MSEKRNAYRLLVGKPEGKRPLGRPRRRWMDNIRMDLGEVGWGDVCPRNLRINYVPLRIKKFILLITVKDLSC